MCCLEIPSRGALRGGAPLQRALLAIVLVLGLTWSPVAAAYHDDEEHITDDTAWTLRGPKNWRIGLYKASATIADRVMVGTYLLPWLARTPSAFAKVRFLSLGPTEWAVEGGFLRLDTSVFDAAGSNAPVFTVGTLELVSSIQLSRGHQLSTSLVGTAVRASGELDEDTLRGNGSAGLTNLQLLMAYEWRITRTLALVVTGRYQLLQVLDARTRLTATPDEYTDVELVLAVKDDDVVNFRYAFSIVPALAWSWEYFNLRLGVGYGNFNIPGVNFMINRRTPIPELDLYWTF